MQGGPNVITWDLKSRRGSQRHKTEEEAGENRRLRGTQPTIADSEMEGTMSQGGF